MTAMLRLVPPLARLTHDPEMTPVVPPYPRLLPPDCGVAVPVTYDDSFFDDARAALDAESLLAVNRACSWSARNSMSGFVPTTQLAEFTRDPDSLTRKTQVAGIAKRVKRGIQFLPGKGITIVNADGSALPVHEPPPAPPRQAAPHRLKRSPGARRVALLRAPGLKQAVRDRDGDLCRYCGVAVRWGQGRAADSGTWDWVDPLGDATVENIVTACKACGERKAVRSLAGSGLALLPPGKRYTADPCNASGSAARNASELGNDNSAPGGNASCNAYTGSRNAYTGEMPAQKRYTPARKDDDLDRSNQSSPGVNLSPAPPRLDARARKAKPGTSVFRLHVIARFAAVNGRDIGPETADLIAADVLEGRKDVGQLLPYVLAAIDKEQRPFERWLSGQPEDVPEPVRAPAKPAALEWCRECDPIDRTVYDEELRRITRCPNCSPKSFAAHIARPGKETAA